MADRGLVEFVLSVSHAGYHPWITTVLLATVALGYLILFPRMPVFAAHRRWENAIPGLRPLLTWAPIVGSGLATATIGIVGYVAAKAILASCFSVLGRLPAALAVVSASAIAGVRSPR
ncbi:hypothetical protein [Paractinoplanes globisporus]|uniref:Uncharacterized protein n=1 Tax=Paractinoplanes globisporus TaxID=113565 RepID=A0ABW6WT05_9ACTN|nr:hypothetical protein [Actinoplanes globisporus]